MPVFTDYAKAESTLLLKEASNCPGKSIVVKATLPAM
jgi:hypothetical protein